MIQHLNQEFGIEKLVVGAEYIKLIWVPDTFFVNEKIALFHQATTENQFLRITHTGEVLRSMRLTIKATCPMNLANFPFDEQMCTVEIESFGYTMADLKYRWNDGNKSVQMSPDVALPQFLVLGHRQRFIEVSLSSGNYSRLLADVQFIRSMGYYMIQVRSMGVHKIKVARARAILPIQSQQLTHECFNVSSFYGHIYHIILGSSPGSPGPEEAHSFIIPS